MAQAEDTELRDLVIEALQKNGSLAKIRALLRANIFLAFEDENENIKNNINLDNILRLPEGVLSLCIVHEFLEFCNLKNTLFVYKAESRQNKEYNYEGKKALGEKLHINEKDNLKEPILLTLIQNLLKPFRRKCYDRGDVGSSIKQEQNGNYNEDQNCTYIVHDESNSATSNSQSDNSSDEKNKLHLRLQLDNSDTDTSSDSTRDKSSSEYIPNEHNVSQNLNRIENKNMYDDEIHNKNILLHDEDKNQNVDIPHYIRDLKTPNNSTDSTSYVELKPYNSLEEKMLNTTGIPHKDIDESEPVNIVLSIPKSQSLVSKGDIVLSATMSNVSSISSHEKGKTASVVVNSEEGRKSDGDSAEYSLDFTSSETSKNNDMPIDNTNSVKCVQDNNILNDLNTKILTNSPNQNSNSSHSSVSISDVADLIEYSEKNLSSDKQKDSHTDKSLEHSEFLESLKSNNKSRDISKSLQKKFSDDSADFSVSSVPSLSNLSLDIHSD